MKYLLLILSVFFISCQDNEEPEINITDPEKIEELLIGNWEISYMEIDDHFYDTIQTFYSEKSFCMGFYMRHNKNIFQMSIDNVDGKPIYTADKSCSKDGLYSGEMKVEDDILYFYAPNGYYSKHEGRLINFKPNEFTIDFFSYGYDHLVITYKKI